MKFDSLAESVSAPVIAALGGRRCTSFSPHLPDFYKDASDEELKGEPDFIIQCQHGPVFMDLKSGSLNNHYTRESSREALADEYMRILHRPAYGLSHAELSSTLYHSGRMGYLAALNHGFNHSLWKLVALQAQHGWRNFVVCFEKNPTPADAKRYCDAGLVWCTLKTLPQLLIRMELEAAGIPISFVHRAQKYECKVEFDNGTATPAEIRSQFLSVVAANQAAIDAERAEAAAALATGILPF